MFYFHSNKFASSAQAFSVNDLRSYQDIVQFVMTWVFPNLPSAIYKWNYYVCSVYDFVTFCCSMDIKQYVPTRKY